VLKAGRTAGTAAVALTGVLWPAQNVLRGRTDLPLPGAGVAEAGDEWCDVDPILLIKTPKGNLATVFYLTGVCGPRDLVGALLGLLSADYSVQPDGDGTRVTLDVLVPKGLLGLGFGSPRPTRLKVTSGLLGSGDHYGSTTGETGKVMTVDFRLDVP
jgi:hypothetical protein